MRMKTISDMVVAAWIGKKSSADPDFVIALCPLRRSLRISRSRMQR